MNRRPMTEALCVPLDEESTRFLRGPTAGDDRTEPIIKAHRAGGLPGCDSGSPGFDQEFALASITVRIPRQVPGALFQASVDRRIQRKRPWTQQAIVTEALLAWLRQHGYLP